jgi:hypothetical protein
MCLDDLKYRLPSFSEGDGHVCLSVRPCVILFYRRSSIVIEGECIN